MWLLIGTGHESHSMSYESHSTHGWAMRATAWATRATALPIHTGYESPGESKPDQRHLFKASVTHRKASRDIQMKCPFLSP